MNKFIFLILLFSSQLEGQIQGLSASKLSTLNVTPVGHTDAEFEPTYSSSWSDIANSSSKEVSSSINWRMTLGLYDKLELGINIPADVSSGSISFKVPVLVNSIYKLGIFGGVTLPFGNRTSNAILPKLDEVGTYGMGAAASFEIDSLTSIDVNIQFVDYFNEAYELGPGGWSSHRVVSSSAIYINANIGSYVLSDKLMLIAGGGYQTFQDYWNANLFVEYGISLEWNPKYIFVLSGFNSAWTKGIEPSAGYSLSFTTLW